MVKNSKILLWLVVAGSLALFQVIKPAAQAEQKEAAANLGLADILSGLSSEQGPWKNMSDIIQGYEPVGWQSFQGESKVLEDRIIKTFASSSDSRYLAYVLKSGQSVIYIRDMFDLQKEPVTLQGYRGGDLLFSPDGRFLAAKNIGKKVQIWGTSESGAELNHLVQTDGFFFSPDNKYVVGWSSNRILVYDLTNNQVIIPDFKGLMSVRDVKCSLNAIAIHSGNVVLISDMPKSFNEPLPPTKRSFPTPESSSMIFSADGRYLATRGADNGFMVWDIEKESRYPLLFHSDKNDRVGNVVFSPQGDYFFADFVSPRRERVGVWDMRALKIDFRVSDLKRPSEFTEDVAFYEPSMTLESSSSPIAFSPNGHDIALVQRLNTLKIGNIQDINVKSKALKSPFSIYRSTHLFFSPGGRYLVAKERYYDGGPETALAVWDTYNFAQAPIKFNDRIMGVVFSPDDRSMALVTLTGITLYNIDAMQDRIASEQLEARQEAKQASQQKPLSVLERVRQLQRASKPVQQPQPSKSELPEAKEQEEKKQIAERAVQEGSAKKIYPSRFDVVQQQQARERAQAQPIREQQEPAERLQRFKERASQRGQASMADILLNLSNKDLLGRLFPKQEPAPKQELEPKRPMPSRFNVFQQQKERGRLEAERIREQDGQ